MITKQSTPSSGSGLYTDEAIKKGTILFSHDDWVEDEKEGWVTLTAAEMQSLTGEKRSLFLRYCYDLDFDKTIGTFDWNCARHIANYMNHSCDPNMVYDSRDNIIARRDIAPGEELTVDYGTFIANFDQEFTCSCGAHNCRKKITKDDWKTLVPVYGIHFAAFLQDEIKKLRKEGA